MPVLVHPVQPAPATEPKPGPTPTRVRALEDRIACEITFPRLLGYRYELAGERLTANVHRRVPTWRSRPRHSRPQTENAPIVGETSIHTLDDLKRRRPNEVAFLLAEADCWRSTSATTTANDQARGSSRNCWASPSAGWPSASRSRTTPSRSCCCLIELGPRCRRPHLPGHRHGDSRWHSRRSSRSSAPTTRSARRATWTSTPPGRSTQPATRSATSPTSSPTPTRGSRRWPQTLEDMAEVVRYVKNQNLGFTIPYTLNGEEQQYIPDFIALHRRRPRPRRPAEPDRRSHRREEEGQGGQGGTPPHAVGAGRQQPRRLRTLGVRRDHRPVGRRRTLIRDHAATARPAIDYR